MNKNELFRIYSELDRSLFLEERFKPDAGYDGPLPIGYGQTISQPSLVLQMTALLEPDKNCRVLEIGTGSGYQTALLSACAAEVFTVELVPELAKKAKERLDALGYSNIFYKVGDGSDGWIEHAPFDRVIVTAAAGKIPRELVCQLKSSGKMIAPIGPPGCQDLMIITRGNNGIYKAVSAGKVTFVEMRGKYGWDSLQENGHK